MTKKSEKLSSKYPFIMEDFKKSGINEDTIMTYITEGHLSETDQYWDLQYIALTANYKTKYYNRRLKNPEYGKGKYIKPAGEPSRIFRPLQLASTVLLDPNKYIIITEGDKKAIKATQEGFNCVSLSGVWNWKCKPTMPDEEQEDWEAVADIIPDLVNIDINGKVVYLCYDNDMWHNPKVKQALYSLAAYLISEKKAVVKIIYLPKGEAKGLDDYLIAYGAEKFQELMDKAQSITLKQIQAKLSDKKDLRKFPIEIFPEKVQELITELHKRKDAPLEYIAVTFLMVTSILMDGHFTVKVNSGSNWIEYPILWVALVGNPSQKKTPCLQIGKEILDKYNQILQSFWETDMSNYLHKKDCYKRQLVKYKNAIKKDEHVEKVPEEPEKPVRPRLMTQDTTKESLAYLMDANSKLNLGIAIFVDELAFFLKSLNQYKRGGNDLEYFLSAWTKDKVNIVRKSDKSDYTFNVSHNIIGTIQPKVLDKTIFASGIESYNGMIERWLFCCSDYQETGIAYNSDALYDLEDFISLCDAIFRHSVIKREEVLEYSFSIEAQQLFNKFKKRIIDLKKLDKNSDLMKSYLEKQTRYVARFALLLQALFDLKEKKIPAKRVKDAIKLSQYFVSCFRNLIQERVEYDELEDYTLNYIRRKGFKSISPTALYKNSKSKIKNTKIAENILTNLAHKGYGRIVKVKNGVKFIVYES